MILFRRQMVNVHVSQQIAFFYYPLYFSSFLPGCSLASILTKKEKKKKYDGQDHDCFICFIFYVLSFFIFNLACSFCQRPKWSLKLFSSNFFFMDQVCLPCSLQQGISLHSSFNITPMKDADLFIYLFSPECQLRELMFTLFSNIAYVC